MNKNFETAKILATISGFVVVASSVFFTSSGNHLDSSFKVLEINETIASRFVDISAKEYELGSDLLKVSIVLAAMCMVFLALGYMEELKRDTR